MNDIQLAKLQKIKRVCENAFGVRDICTKNRTRDTYTYARASYSYLAKKYADSQNISDENIYKKCVITWRNIGELIKRSHATIIHLDTKVKDTYITDYYFREKLYICATKLNLKELISEDIADYSFLDMSIGENENYEALYNSVKGLDKEGIIELIKTRIEPFLKMYKTR